MKFVLRILSLTVFIVLPSLLWAQSETFVPRSKIIRDRSFKWLNDGERKFKSETDSIEYLKAIIGADTTKYETSEAALLDINDLLTAVESNNIVLKNRNEGLGLRLNSIVSQNKEKARVADDVYLELLKKEETTVEDFIEIKKRYGNRPTYFVNGKEVGQDMLDRIKESYILNRDIRVASTVSGNPNGEIWIDITPSSARKLKLDQYVYKGNANNVVVEDNVKIIEETEYKVIPKEEPAPESAEPVKQQNKQKEEKKQGKKEVKKDQPKQPEKDTNKRSVRRVKQNIQNKK
ncbi:hypothetical protein [Dysgonomonas sp. 25]|uniref:hypothetical protein n=1 Tax=Dysgonomonas sp. 25 TaxID=2302933 RepID=UPI0013D430F9|nr:hypothetical protein [Dysgonomonas sp. 25]NDV68853.1 hypothetical protein [Dysgonomonas sp. 25]